MKAYLVSGFIVNSLGTSIITLLFDNIDRAKQCLEEYADEVKDDIISDYSVRNNIFSDSLQNICNSPVVQKRTIEIHLNLDKETDKRFYKTHNIAQMQLDAFTYNRINLCDRNITSIKLMDLKIKEVEL